MAAYASQLEGRQRAAEARLKASVGRDFDVQHRMQHAFNGIVAELTPAEAAAFANDPSVTLVEPYTEYALDDEVAPSVIGANPVWEDGTGFHRAAFISRGRTEVSVYNRRAKGEGVIVGIVDSGINFASPSFAGVEPEVMGVGPVPSTERALARTGLTIDDIGLFELNEAFAVQVLAFLDHFGIADDDERVNPWGGAIAVGHPLASSGVRLMTQLSRQFAERPDVRYGLTAMCVGLGMGATVIWENPNWEGFTK